MEAITLFEEDTKKFEDLQLETTALRMTIAMQHEAVAKHTKDLAARTAAHWKDIYERLGLLPTELWRYENGSVIKVQPPEDTMQKVAQMQAGFTGEADDPRRRALEDEANAADASPAGFVQTEGAAVVGKQDGIALKSEAHPGLNADMSGPAGTPLEDGSPDITR